MDAKKLEEIKAAHEAAKGEMPACSVGLEAHRHRGWLLDAIAEALAERAGFADQIAELTRDVEHEALRARKAEQQANDRPSRPRVGPWVEEDGESKRFDDHGFQVGEVWGGDEDGFEWLAQRAGMPPARGLDMSRAAACAAADAVLATWADLDGVAVAVAVADTLSQARALLRRVRLRLGGHPKDGNAASVAHDVQMVDEIDAFLAGLPPVPRATEEDVKRWIAWRGSVSDLATDIRKALSSEQTYRLFCNLGEGKDAPRTWTEEQIREAYHTCAPKPREKMVDAILRVLRGEP